MIDLVINEENYDKFIGILNDDDFEEIIIMTDDDTMNIGMKDRDDQFNRWIGKLTKIYNRIVEENNLKMNVALYMPQNKKFIIRVEKIKKIEMNGDNDVLSIIFNNDTKISLWGDDLEKEKEIIEYNMRKFFNKESK